MSPPNERVAVVVATRNRAGLLARCLHSIGAQATLPEVIVVVDDASTDGTQSVIAHAVRAGTPVRSIRLDSRSGPACARNMGWRSTACEWIAFTDDDCEPEPSWLDELGAALARESVDVAGIGGRVVPGASGVIGRYMTHHRILEPPATLGYLVTANCLYWRSALEAVGGFDERVRQPGGEDPGLSFALRRAGFRFVRAEAAVVKHHYRENVFDFVRTFFNYGRGCRIVVGQ